MAREANRKTVHRTLGLPDDGLDLLERRRRDRVRQFLRDPAPPRRAGNDAEAEQKNNFSIM